MDELPSDEASPPLDGVPSYGTDGFTQQSIVDTTRIPAVHKSTERSPLLQRSQTSRSRSRRRLSSVGPHGDATVTDAVLMVRDLSRALLPATKPPVRAAVEVFCWYWYSLPRQSVSLTSLHMRESLILSAGSSTVAYCSRAPS